MNRKIAKICILTILIHGIGAKSAVTQDSVILKSKIIELDGINSAPLKVMCADGSDACSTPLRNHDNTMSPTQSISSRLNILKKGLQEMKKPAASDQR